MSKLPSGFKTREEYNAYMQGYRVQKKITEKITLIKETTIQNDNEQTNGVFSFDEEKEDLLKLTEYFYALAAGLKLSADRYRIKLTTLKPYSIEDCLDKTVWLIEEQGDLLRNIKTVLEVLIRQHGLSLSDQSDLEDKKQTVEAAIEVSNKKLKQITTAKEAAKNQPELVIKK